MSDLSTPFVPNWVSPPGDTVLDIIDERGWTQKELAIRLGCSEKHLSLLVNGEVSLTHEIAMKLERVLGSTFQFWLSREANYREQKARLEAIKKCAEWGDWLESIPTKELKQHEYIPNIRKTKDNIPLLVESCLRFFKVASPDEYISCYVQKQYSFRRSRPEQPDIGAITTWLRMGEIEAEKISVRSFDKKRFESALSRIRQLTVLKPELFRAELNSLLSDSGVKLVLVPAIPRARVSGVARWLNRSTPLIQLSLYGKFNDRFWFTFFHEAAHLLLHANNNSEKESVFLDDPTNSDSEDPKEIEANEWAGEFLIPAAFNAILPSLQSRAAVVEFAEKLGIHPGIVVGRLQHEGIIPLSWMHDLKEKFILAK